MLKPWMHPRSCFKCERRFLLEACDCERKRRWDQGGKSLACKAGRAAVAILFLITLAGCFGDDGGGSTICPAPDYPGACRHAAVYCALVAGQTFDEEPVIVTGLTHEGAMHAECMVGGRWVRMAYQGIILDEAPLIPMRSESMQEYTVEDFMFHYFGWACP